MLSIKGHFDGAAVVLDEPVSLAIGQPVRVVVETQATDKDGPASSLLAGSAMEGNESAAFYIDALNAVPADFVRRPGTAAGEIKMTEDFDETPDEFKEYL